jgi:hypothetical protein
MKQGRLDVDSQGHRGFTPVRAVVNAFRYSFGQYSIKTTSLSALLDSGADRSLGNGGS